MTRTGADHDLTAALHRLRGHMLARAEAAGRVACPNCLSRNIGPARCRDTGETVNQCRRCGWRMEE